MEQKATKKYVNKRKQQKKLSKKKNRLPTKNCK